MVLQSSFFFSSIFAITTATSGPGPACDQNAVMSLNNVLQDAVECQKASGVIFVPPPTTFDESKATAVCKSCPKFVEKIKPINIGSCELAGMKVGEMIEDFKTYCDKIATSSNPSGNPATSSYPPAYPGTPATPLTGNEGNYTPYSQSNNESKTIPTATPTPVQANPLNRGSGEPPYPPSYPPPYPPGKAESANENAVKESEHTNHEQGKGEQSQIQQNEHESDEESSTESANVSAKSNQAQTGQVTQQMQTSQSTEQTQSPQPVSKPMESKDVESASESKLNDTSDSKSENAKDPTEMKSKTKKEMNSSFNIQYNGYMVGAIIGLFTVYFGF